VAAEEISSASRSPREADRRFDRALVLEALGAAVGRRVPNAGLVHHSDRGSQYASADYQAALKSNGVVCSMSRKGNCWDNAVAESFFATLKTESSTSVASRPGKKRERRSSISSRCSTTASVATRPSGT
jgi:transposase InsO family protein